MRSCPRVCNPPAGPLVEMSSWRILEAWEMLAESKMHGR